MSELKVPIFPLNTVLFPGGPLPLRVFEPRYLDMVSDCLRRNSSFGVCLIESGSEIGEAASTYEVGTLARITDWHRRQDGLLGITVVGEQRFKVISREVLKNRLTEASVELLPLEKRAELPDDYIAMADVLRQLLKQVGDLYASTGVKYGDASWVGNRLAELLPLPLTQKQHLLQIDEPIQRLERIRQMLDAMEIHY